jgi:hypothetical protein
VPIIKTAQEHKYNTKTAQIHKNEAPNIQKYNITPVGK